MSKYVPSFLRKSGSSTNTEQAAPTESFRSFVREDPVVVNTSLPARMATPLPPATLASLTADKGVERAPNAPLAPMAPIPRRAAPPLPKEDDFPALGKAPAKVAPANTGVSFRSLAQDWAVKQKADTEAAAEQKAKELIARQLASAEAARVEREERDIRRMARLGRVGGIDHSEEEEEECSEPSTEPSDYEEEEEIEVDDDWGSRKHRNELY